MFKALIHDFEGPWVDLEGLHHEGHLRAARQVGIEMTVQEAMLKCPHFIGGPDLAVAEDIANLLNTHPDLHGIDKRLHDQGVLRGDECLVTGGDLNEAVDPQVILRLDRDFYNQALHALEVIPLRPGAEKTLDFAKRLGLKSVIATAIPKSDFDHVVKASGINRLFPREDILWGDKKPSTNPKENVFVQALEYLSVRADEAIVIEDTHRGVAAAKAAGIPVIAIPVYWGNNLAALGNAGADLIVPDWEALNVCDGPRLFRYLRSRVDGRHPK